MKNFTIPLIAIVLSLIAILAEDAHPHFRELSLTETIEVMGTTYIIQTPVYVIPDDRVYCSYERKYFHELLDADIAYLQQKIIVDNIPDIASDEYTMMHFSKLRQLWDHRVVMLQLVSATSLQQMSEPVITKQQTPKLCEYELVNI